MSELTQQTILDAIEKANQQGYTVCVGSNQHVVHPEEYERGGLARCAACFQVVDLGPVTGGSTPESDSAPSGNSPSEQVRDA
jgi:hypothetical protein